MGNGDIIKMLQASPSPKITVTFNDKSNGTYDHSLKTSVDKALMLYNQVNCSLYFRGSDQLNEQLVKHLMEDLGANFGGRFPVERDTDSDKTSFKSHLKGETEVFLSKKDSLTDWHIDFQHNFTLQLRGSKRW